MQDDYIEKPDPVVKAFIKKGIGIIAAITLTISTIIRYLFITLIISTMTAAILVAFYILWVLLTGDGQVWVFKLPTGGGVT